MELINDKIEDGGATADGRHAAIDFNQRNPELQNAVLRSGQTLSSSLVQLAEALFLNATKAHSFQDTGPASAINTVDLRPISGVSGVRVPTNYSAMGGSEISFVASFTNVGPVKLGLGQTATIGFLDVKLLDGSQLVGGEIRSDQVSQVTLNTSSTEWILTPWSLSKGIVGLRDFFNSGVSIYNKPINVRAVLSITTASGGGGGFVQSLLGSGNALSGGAGGGGATILEFISFTPGGATSLELTVGNGGTPGDIVIPNGGNGQVSTIGFPSSPLLVSAPGGLGGSGIISQSGLRIFDSGTGGFAGQIGLIRLIGGSGQDGSVSGHSSAELTPVGGHGGDSFLAGGGNGAKVREAGSNRAALRGFSGSGGGGGASTGTGVSVDTEPPEDGGIGRIILLEIA